MVLSVGIKDLDGCLLGAFCFFPNICAGSLQGKYDMGAASECLDLLKKKVQVSHHSEIPGYTGNTMLCVALNVGV